MLRPLKKPVRCYRRVDTPAAAGGSFPYAGSMFGAPYFGGGSSSTARVEITADWRPPRTMPPTMPAPRPKPHCPCCQ